MRADVSSEIRAKPRARLNPWDFTDVWTLAIPAAGPHNGAITIADAIAVVAWIGTSDGGPPNASGRQYNQDSNANGIADGVEYGRTFSTIAGQPWRPGPLTGATSMADALVVINSIGDHC